MTKASDNITIETLADDLSREQLLSTELAVDNESLTFLLSQALAALEELTQTNQRLRYRLQQLLQLNVDDPARQRGPITLVPPMEYDVPQDMTRLRDIRWKST